MIVIKLKSLWAHMVLFVAEILLFYIMPGLIKLDK